MKHPQYLYVRMCAMALRLRSLLCTLHRRLHPNSATRVLGDQDLWYARKNVNSRDLACTLLLKPRAKSPDCLAVYLEKSIAATVRQESGTWSLENTPGVIAAFMSEYTTWPLCVENLLSRIYDTHISKWKLSLIIAIADTSSSRLGIKVS